MTGVRDWDIASLTTLYANWITNYTVTFESNGGSSVSSQEIPQGSLVIEPPAPSLTGYTFGGWYADSGLTDPWNFSADTVTGNITIYAKWMPNIYTVTLNMQGGTGGTASVDATYFSSMPSASAPVLSGYTFEGYYTGTNGTGTRYYDSTMTGVRNWDIASATTLYANWIPNYTVTFESNGGSSVSSQEIPQGGLVTEPADPEKTGYTFSGWYSDSGLLNLWNFSTETVIADITIYAKWTPNIYTVTLDMQGGTGGTASVDATFGSEMPAATAPARTGFDFEGYYSGTNGTGNKYYDSTMTGPGIGTLLL